MTHFCIDIDNVIGGTDEVMRQVIAEFTKGRVQLTYENVREFNYWECKDDRGNSIDKEEWNSIHALFSESRYLRLIEPLSGALDGITLLSKKADLHFATARLPKAHVATVEWLKIHNFPPCQLHFLKHGEKHISLQAITAAVEDDYSQACAFAIIGKTPCFLLRHPWNTDKREVDGVHWVDTWPELTNRLLALT